MMKSAHIALYAMFLAAALITNNGIAQDMQSASKPDAPPLSDSPSKLPPIFFVGNKIAVAGKLFIGTVTIREVRGEWILVNAAGVTPAWIRPASMDATWSQSQ